MPVPRQGLLDDAANRRMVQSSSHGHEARAPVRAPVGGGRGMQHPVDNCRFVGRGQAFGSARAGPVAGKAGEPLRLEAIEPQGDGRPRDPQGGTDGTAGFAGGGGQHNPGAFYLAVGRGARAGHALQARAVPASQSNHTNRKWHAPQ